MSDIIERCNFKSVDDLSLRMSICNIAHLAINFAITNSDLKILNAKCVGEENCVLYQGYKNSVLMRGELIDGKLQDEIERRQGWVR